MGYSDQSFPARNNDNGIDALGVANGAIADLNGGFGDVIAVIGPSVLPCARPAAAARQRRAVIDCGQAT